MTHCVRLLALFWLAGGLFSTVQSLTVLDKSHCQALAKPPNWFGISGCDPPPPCNGMFSLTCDSQTGKVENIVLGNKKLRGTLPSSWSALTTLKIMFLQGNLITGTLPASWSALASVKQMWLKDNQIRGSLPSSWGKMASLSRAMVSGNKLCGAIPSALRLKVDVRSLPTCPKPVTPKPPAAKPTPHCGPWYSRVRCVSGNCCSRWGWCGKSQNHCQRVRGCQTTFGSCTATGPPLIPGLNTDEINCGDTTRCKTGYCCNVQGKCSTLVADCSPARGCQPAYGMCYSTADDLQSEIDVALDPAVMGRGAVKHASTKTSNATLLSVFSFHYPTKPCAGKPQPCIIHVVQPGQTLVEVAARYGTNTWQLLLDNPLLVVYVGGAATLRPYDRLAVRPAPGAEGLRWGWKRQEALILGSANFPRPCSGYRTTDQRMSCFCHYHADGSYVWPFSSGGWKCREVVECRGGKPVGRSFKQCPATTVADDSLEFNGNTQCLKRPANFECSNGDGCWSALCFCREFLLADGIYQNPFDSTRSTALLCDHNQPGWFGGLYDCGAPNFFDPVKRVCTTASQAKIPFRRGYTSCDGVPDPDVEPVATTGRRKLAAYRNWRPVTLRRLNSRKSCTSYSKGVRAGCVPCEKYGCRDGKHVFLHIASAKKKGCQCHVYGSCPIWFNKRCRFAKPRR